MTSNSSTASKRGADGKPSHLASRQIGGKCHESLEDVAVHSQLTAPVVDKWNRGVVN
jgi:hypothetical protein